MCALWAEAAARHDSHSEAAVEVRVWLAKGYFVEREALSWVCLNYNSTYNEQPNPLIKMLVCVCENSPGGLIS